MWTTSQIRTAENQNINIVGSKGNIKIKLFLFLIYDASSIWVGRASAKKIITIYT